MIIVNLKGGLGNQMFQYACGRALSLRRADPELKLDIQNLERANLAGDIYRPYSLSIFDIKAEIAEEDQVARIKNPYGMISRVWRYAVDRLFFHYIPFIPLALRYRDNKYLNGYFQTERYFKDFEDDIRRDFMLKQPSPIFLEWSKKIESDPASVSVHIRRGDYVGHTKLGNICTPEYYHAALEEISSKISSPRFYVFSDDIPWARENIRFPSGAEFMSKLDIKDGEELLLMSRCRHNIIANSSFSWWAAWLNGNTQKIVIAPKKWAHGWINILKLKDMLPDSWIRI